MVDDCGFDVHIVKELSPKVMLKRSLIIVRPVVVDNKLMHSGSVPDRKMVEVI